MMIIETTYMYGIAFRNIQHTKNQHTIQKSMRQYIYRSFDKISEKVNVTLY